VDGGALRLRRHAVACGPIGVVPDAVMFDLDGVLVESEQLWDAARRRVVQENGGRWSAQAGTDMLGMSAPAWSRHRVARLGVEPAACVAVEDSSNGLRSASAAGMAVVAVPNATFPPAPDALALAVMTIGTVRELTPEVIQRAAHHGCIAPARAGGPAAHDG